MNQDDPDQSELNKEFILALFYNTKGNLDEINRVIDARLIKSGFRKITLFEEFIKNRLAINPSVLKMPQMEISAVETIYLSQYPALEGLEVLDLRKNHIGDDGLAAISQSPFFGELKELDLRNNGITRLGMKVLSESKGLESLEKIDLRTNKLGKRWETKLREVGNFPNLKELKIA